MSATYGVAVVAAKTSVGTQDITSTDLGGATPVAALFFFSRSAANGVVSTDSQEHYGATDGVNQWAYASCNVDGVPTNWPQRGGSDCCLCSLKNDGTLHSKASVVGFIPNGVTVNWTTVAADGWIVTAMFIAGSDWTATVGTALLTETVTLGYQPDAVLLANNSNYLTDGNILTGELKSSFGWAVFSGTHYQSQFCQAAIGGQQAGFSPQITGASGSFPGLVTKYNLSVTRNATGFVMGSGLGVPHRWGYLALKYTGVGSLQGGIINITGSAAGAQSFTGFGATPGPFLMLLQFQRTNGGGGEAFDYWRWGASLSTIGNTGGWTIGGGPGIIGPYGLLNPPYNNFGCTSDGAITMVGDAGSVNAECTLQSFDADGLTLNFTIPPPFDPSHRTLAYWSWLYLTLVGAPVPPPPPPPPPPPVLPRAGFIIERFDNRVWPTVENCWCVDCGFTLARPTPAADLLIGSAFGAGILTGVTGLVGGSGYSAATVATVVDNNGLGPGTGAVPALIIVDGVITSVTFATPGANYVDPVLVFYDPENLGSGASATVTMDNSAALVTDPPIFVLGDVGSVIRAGYGVAVITAFVDASTVTASILSPIVQIQPDDPIDPTQVINQKSGTWTMTAPISSFYLPQLIGFEITGLADGQIIPPVVVPDDGIVTLATPASAIIVGLSFQAQLQSTYLDAGEPTVQGQRKKIAEVTVRVEQSAAFQIGSNQPDGSVQSPQQLAPLWQNMVDAPTHAVAPFNSPATPLFTGDVRIPTPGGFNTRGQVAVQQLNPLPLQVLDYATEVLSGDKPAQEAPPRKGKGEK
jgi:hypothetical protein